MVGAVGGDGVPLNPTTGKSYRGGNATHPMGTGIRRAFEIPAR